VKLRIKGVPVFFTPYFSHPSPDVKRKTGILTPIMRCYSDVGIYAGIPIYVAIAPDRDMKLTPFFSSKKRWLAAMEYRQKFIYGDLDVSASVLRKSTRQNPVAATTTVNTATANPLQQTNSAAAATTAVGSDSFQINKHTRWHIETSYTSRNLDNKRLLLKLDRASDVTYKTLYPVRSTKNVNNEWLAEKYNDSAVVFDAYDKNYYLVTESHYYQTSEKLTAPFICPHINFKGKKAEVMGGIMSFDSDTVYLARRKEKSSMLGKDFFRTTNKVNWNKSFDMNMFLLELNSGVRADIYDITATKQADSQNDIFPVLENQISISAPYVSKVKSNTAIWGPKLTFNSVETSNRRANYPYNEDSVFDNCSDLSLHSLNRYGGYDAIENGERISFGFENSIYNDKRRWINIFVGRSANIGNRQKKKFPGKAATVGRLVLKPMENLSFRLRFVGIPFVENVKLIESGVSTTYKNVSLSVGYFYGSKITGVQENGVAQLGLNCGIKLSEFWSVAGSEVMNLKNKNGKRSLVHMASLRYEDECFEFKIGIHKTNLKDSDIKPRIGINLTIAFKTLGSFNRPTNKHLHKGDIGAVS
jgi:LPS-assembly protein